MQSEALQVTHRGHERMLNTVEVDIGESLREGGNSFSVASQSVHERSPEKTGPVDNGEFAAWMDELDFGSCEELRESVSEPVHAAVGFEVFQ